MGNCSLVIVSHSQKLAAGLMEILRQLADGRVYTASAAGTEDELGTNAVSVLRALEGCPQTSGIVVLFDIGSALLSCETAIDLAADELKQRTLIADAPLVEGAIAACVEASLGRPLHTVVQTAERAGRAFKRMDH